MINISTPAWKTKYSQILLKMDQKAFILLIIIFNFYVVGISFRRFLSIDDKFFLFLRLPLISIVSLIIIWVIKRSRESNLKHIYMIIVLIYDFGITYSAIFEARFKNDELFYIRLLYIFMLFSIVQFQVRAEISSRIYFFQFVIKLGSLIVFLIYYDFQFKNEILFDALILIIAMCLIIMNKSFKDFFKENIEKLHYKNSSLTEKFRNIINTINKSLISINTNRFEVMVNLSMINFLKENHTECNERMINLMLVDKPNDFEKVVDPNAMFTDNEKVIIEQMRSKITKEKSLKKFQIFEQKLAIIHKFLNEMSSENTLKHEKFSLFEILSQHRVFEEKEQFVLYGIFRINSKIIEVSWKRTVYKNEEVVFDLILDDITNSREIIFNKADMKFRQLYLAKIAHEFKTPVTSLIESVKKFVNIKNLACNYILNIEEHINDYKFIEGQANYISMLIHDINDYCKEIKDFEYNIDDFCIRDVIQFVAQILFTLINKNTNKKENVKINLHISDNVPEKIRSDEKRLKQLLVNLISNSVKFTNFGHIGITVDYINNNGGYNELTFCVEDTGIGISSEEQTKLFQDHSLLNKDHFYLNKEGSGLGLSICKKIVEKLGNNISCESHSSLTKFNFSIYDNIQVHNVMSQQIHVLETEETKYLNTHYFDNIDINNEELSIAEKSCIKSGNLSLGINKSIEDKPLSISNTSFNVKTVSPNLIFNDRENDKNNVRTDNLSSKLDDVTISINMNKVQVVPDVKNEEMLRAIIGENNTNKIKINFLNFNKSLIKFTFNFMNFSENTNIILIVDDHKYNSKSLKRQLNEIFTKKNLHNHKVIIASDGIEALNLLYYDTLYFMKISIIISDINMNFMNGDNLYKTINLVNFNSFQRYKFVLFSNTNVDTNIDSDKGTKFFIKKPCRKADVEEMLKGLNFFEC
jgi:signal transduction histidine kinase/CheY-like chemotaxis protein